jgi:hypothetical protein
MELELIGTGPDAHVEFVFCEGWCSSLHKAPVEFPDQSLTFAYTEQYVSHDGSPASALRYEVSAVPISRGLRVTVTPADYPEETFTANLPRIGERFGLAVAAGED